MPDLNIDKLMKACITEVIDKQPSMDFKALFQSLARQMFKNFSALEVYEIVDNALAEASDENWFENKYRPEEIQQIGKPKIEYKQGEAGNTLSSKIAAKVSILFIADKYGLMPLHKTKRICPFHADGNPSLSLSEEKGCFYCFGCGAKGGIIKFYAMLKELNPQFTIKNG